MGNTDIDIKPWESDWELTGSPLYQAKLKPEPLWSCYASIETLKTSPTKFSQNQSTESSRFFSLETTVKGSLFSSSDAKEISYRENSGGDDHSLPAHTSAPATASIAVLSSKPFPVSPPPSQTNERDWSSELSKGSHSLSSGARSIAEETKECDEDQSQTSRSHEGTISRYEALRNQRLKIRDKIAQRRVLRKDIVPADSILLRRKSIESQSSTSKTQETKECSSRDVSNKVRSNAATRIQASFRRSLAKVLIAKTKAEQDEESKRQLQHTNTWNRTARVNDILEKIKERELHHTPYQLGHLYTIQEE